MMTKLTIASLTPVVTKTKEAKSDPENVLFEQLVSHIWLERMGVTAWAVLYDTNNR